MVQSPEELDAFVDSLLKLTSEPERLDRALATRDLKAWLEKYAGRVKSERDLWSDGDVDAERGAAMMAANPRFVLRQWLLEEVIKNVEKDVDSGKRLLAKVLHVCCFCRPCLCDSERFNKPLDVM